MEVLNETEASSLPHDCAIFLLSGTTPLQLENSQEVLKQMYIHPSTSHFG